MKISQVDDQVQKLRLEIRHLLKTSQEDFLTIVMHVVWNKKLDEEVCQKLAMQISPAEFAKGDFPRDIRDWSYGHDIIRKK